MTQYLYPQNLKAAANMWLWSLKDFAILGVMRPVIHCAAGAVPAFIAGCGHALFWISDHPDGRYHHSGFYQICGALFYHNAAVL